MQDFDQDVLRIFRKQVRETGSGTWQDPNHPYLVTVTPSKMGHLIKIEDTRKRWYGRVLTEHEHPLDQHFEIADNGPAAVAIMLMEMVIEKRMPLG